MYSNYATSSYAKSASHAGSFITAGNGVWVIIAAVLAVVGGIVLYFTFLSKRMKENIQDS